MDRFGDRPPDAFTMRMLFDISLGAEREAHAFFSGLGSQFSGKAEVSAFFRDMASDEADHINMIEKFLSTLPPQKIDGPAPSHAVQMAKEFLKFTASDALASIRTLDDAYRIMVKIEFSEVNRLFELLAESTAESPAEIQRTRAMLEGHLDKVKAFPSKFGDTTVRQSIRPTVS